MRNDGYVPNEQAVIANHKVALGILTGRDLYFAMNYFLLAVLRPIDEQGDSRQVYMGIGLGFIGLTQVLNLAFEFVKYKQLLSSQMEMKVDRIVRHGISGVKDIAILFAFFDVLAGQLTDNHTIVSTATWLDNANPWLKLPIVAVPSALKAAISWYLNKREYEAIIESEEFSALLAQPLTSRKFTRYNALRMGLLLPFEFLKRLVFAAIDLQILQDFGVPVSSSFAKAYIWTKPAIITFLEIAMLDHPVFLRETARRLGRLIQRFLVQAVENAEISFAVILNLLSIRNQQYTLSNPSAANLLLVCYLLSTIVSEAHFRVTAAFNDKNKLDDEKMLSANFIRHLAASGLIAAGLFPTNYYLWPAIAGVSVLTDLMQLPPNQIRNERRDFLIALPKKLTLALASGALALLSVELQTGEMGLGYKLLITLPTAALSFALDFFKFKHPVFKTIKNAAYAGLLGNGTVVALSNLPESLSLPLQNIGFEVAAAVIPAAAVAAKAVWDHRIAAAADPNPSPMQAKKSLPHLKLIENNLLGLWGMLLCYSIAERANPDNESFSAKLTSVLLICLLAAVATYLSYRNAGWSGFSNPLERFGFCQPHRRYERVVLNQVESGINVPGAQ